MSGRSDLLEANTLCACPQMTAKVPGALSLGLQVNFNKQESLQIRNWQTKRINCTYIFKKMKISQIDKEGHQI